MSFQNILHVQKDTKVVLKVLETVQLLNKPDITIPNLVTLTAYYLVGF